MKKNNSGFALLTVLIFTFVVLAGALTLYLVNQRNNSYSPGSKAYEPELPAQSVGGQNRRPSYDRNTNPGTQYRFYPSVTPMPPIQSTQGLKMAQDKMDSHNVDGLGTDLDAAESDLSGN